MGKLRKYVQYFGNRQPKKRKLSLIQVKGSERNHYRSCFVPELWLRRTLSTHLNPSQLAPDKTRHREEVDKDENMVGRVKTTNDST